MGNQVGRHGNVNTLLIIGYNSYIANRLSQRFKIAGINVDFLSQSGVLYNNNNEVLANLFNRKNKNSLKYSYIINCAGPDRKFCEKYPSEAIHRRKIIYKIHKILEYGLAKTFYIFLVFMFWGV